MFCIGRYDFFLYIYQCKINIFCTRLFVQYLSVTVCYPLNFRSNKIKNKQCRLDSDGCQEKSRKCNKLELTLVQTRYSKNNKYLNILKWDDDIKIHYYYQSNFNNLIASK